jgi:2,3,4,5-tetrahydropyridine-2-carboxylate N-succinyltransferase
MNKEKKNNYSTTSYWGLGFRRKKNQETLDVTYSLITKNDLFIKYLCDIFVMFAKENYFKITSIQEIITNFSQLKEKNINENFLTKYEKQRIKEICYVLKNSSPINLYSDIDLIIFYLTDKNKKPQNIEEIYFRLHLISSRWEKPHALNLEGIFFILPTLVWSNFGPIFPKDYQTMREKSLMGVCPPLTAFYVDKIPYLINYLIPSGVRISDGSRVRLGAYLGKGTTVMPAGYVNFNAGVIGPNMVEGRISSGVMVGENSDIGGGASIMGTLSGGNKHVIEIGAQCLIGANAGSGISLGFGCTIAAGTYVTAASKVYLYDNQKNPINLNQNIISEGKNIVKALELSGKNHLLFYFDTKEGKLICRPNHKTINLNPMLHSEN